VQRSWSIQTFIPVTHSWLDAEDWPRCLAGLPASDVPQS
jgi:hypothetical protein